MRRLRTLLVLATATVVLSVVVSAAVDLVLSRVRGPGAEDSLALPLLFWARGPLDPPAELVIVSIDAASKATLNQAERTRDWQRSLHARLLRRLTRLDASAIALDVEFTRETDPSEDKALSDAIREAGNVVLTQRIDRIAGPGVTVEQWQNPIEPLTRFATALAPVPLPDGTVVTQAWSFVPDLDDGGDVATLPAVALQVHARRLLNVFDGILRDAGISVPGPGPGDPAGSRADLRHTMSLIRRAMQDDGRASERALAALGGARADGLATDAVETLEALVRLYRDPSPFYLNFYGPSGTIRTLPYHDALNEAASGAIDFSGKTVFVGAGHSGLRIADPLDTYHPAYGGELTGVEIHATAFANLLRGDALRPAPGLVALTLLVGFALCVTGAAYLLPRRRAGVAALLLAVVYYAGVQIAFNQANVLLPLAVPLLVQAPLAFVAVHFARKPLLKRTVTGTCLVTDVARSTELARSRRAEQLQDLFEEYWSGIRTAATHCSGTVQTPQVGDSLVCFWAAHGAGRSAGRPGAADQRDSRYLGCLAAIEIADAVARFGDAHASEPLPARIGLHAGELSVTYDLDRDRCTVVGDPVNVAKRLEELGKVLFGGHPAAGRSPILASSAVAEGLDGVLTRYLGRHELRGVGPLAVHEIVGRADGVGRAEIDVCERFARALGLYEAARWQEAQLAFNGILTSSGAPDGPSRYFAADCEARLAPAASGGPGGHV
jgi:adenylate cyclase